MMPMLLKRPLITLRNYILNHKKLYRQKAIATNKRKHRERLEGVRYERRKETNRAM